MGFFVVRKYYLATMFDVSFFQKRMFTHMHAIQTLHMLYHKNIFDCLSKFQIFGFTGPYFQLELKI